MTQPNQPKSESTRRDFLKTSGVVGGSLMGGALAGTLFAPSRVHAAGDDTLKIGLIGCGGRGSGAAHQALNADPNVKLVAMADAFADRLASSRQNLEKVAGDKVAVDDDHCFVGFDAYKKVLDSDVDVVLLATPPHFRPVQLRAAIEAGKHVFCEKPVAVDAPGVRSVLETSKLAEQKGLSIVSGLCWRYDSGVRETMNRVLGGEIGDIIAIQENYLTGTLWHHGKEPSWSDMEYQLRNWLYFTWLSGDHNVEQHVHSLDKSAWALGDSSPVSAVGLGGRQVRTDSKWGHIFDHHAVQYEFPNGVRVYSYTRQMDGCSRDVEDYVMGTKGTARILKHSIESRDGETKWRYRGAKPNMYQVEHNELFASIRAGKPINNGYYMANSTMIAIMGRMATYSGQTVTWDQAFNSDENLAPKAYSWGPVETPPVALPGITQLA